jgi:hypothetical protein
MCFTGILSELSVDVLYGYPVRTHSAVYFLLPNQLNFIYNIHKSLAFYHCNMFRQCCAIFREFLHQVLKQILNRRTSAAQEETIQRAGYVIRDKKFWEEHIS